MCPILWINSSIIHSEMNIDNKHILLKKIRTMEF